MASGTRTEVAMMATVLVVGLGATGCGPDDLPVKATDWPVQGEGAPGIDTSIDGQVVSFLGGDNLPGATLAVTRNGRLVWSKGYGLADRDRQIRMQPWHRSRIGSVSKIITTIGMLQLLENNGPVLGGLAAAGGSLEERLAQKVYGHPGTDFTSPSWPTVTGPSLLADPEGYWGAVREGVQNRFAATFDTDMPRMIEWASTVELGHLLSHTSGLLRSGDTDGAAAYLGVDGSELTYPDIHKWVLRGLTESRENGSNLQCYLDGSLYVDETDPDYTGQVYQLPPLLYEPGTDSCYSNHGFGLVGHIIDERSGPGEDNTYRRVIERHVLEPLGLINVVPNNTDIGALDAWPHGSQLDPEDPSTLGLPTGGWSTSAQDLARIMCGLDRASNNLRLLRPQTVTTMESIAYADADSNQPIGWDSRVGERLYKNGAIGGGDSVIIKYLPGSFDSAPSDEINIVININSSAPSHPSTSLLRSIAEKVAAADIPDDYDLFNPTRRCVVERPTLVQPTAVPPVTPSPTRGPDDIVVVPSATPTPRPTLPTVFIRKPAPGRYPAANGTASIDFVGAATDAAGRAIPGTHLRWTAIEGTRQSVLCAGSGIPAEGTPTPTPSGRAVLTDCASFTTRLTTKAVGVGPPITIRLEARDATGAIGTATATIYLVTSSTR